MTGEEAAFEKLWDRIEHDLGLRDHNMRRDRPYTGQAHTSTGVRGSTEIRGVTFRDLRDCFVRAVLLSTGAMTIDGVDMRALYEEADKGENAALCESDLYGFNLDRLDPMAICQNLGCEVEKAMGIFPNVPSLTTGTVSLDTPRSNEQSRLAGEAEYASWVIGVPAHSKSEYKRRVALGDPSVRLPIGAATGGGEQTNTTKGGA